MIRFLLGIISLLLAITHILFVVLLKNKKLSLKDLRLWLSATIVSILIASIEFLYQIFDDAVPLFPMLPIIALVVLIMLAIGLNLLIKKYK